MTLKYEFSQIIPLRSQASTQLSCTREITGWNDNKEEVDNVAVTVLLYPKSDYHRVSHYTRRRNKTTNLKHPKIYHKMLTPCTFIAKDVAKFSLDLQLI